MEPLIQHLKYLLLSSVLIFTISYAASLQLYWCISIYFFMFFKTGTAQPAYDLPGRYFPGTKHIPGISFKSYSRVLVSLAPSFQVCCPALSL